jgi:hypothetical protein
MDIYPRSLLDQLKNKLVQRYQKKINGFKTNVDTLLDISQLNPY